jgi:hypothetical protein
MEIASNWNLVFKSIQEALMLACKTLIQWCSQKWRYLVSDQVAWDGNLGTRHVRETMIHTLMRWWKLVLVDPTLFFSSIIFSTKILYTSIILIKRFIMLNHRAFICRKILNFFVTKTSTNLTNLMCLFGYQGK